MLRGTWVLVMKSAKKGASVFLSGFLQVPPMHTGRKGWSQISSALQFLSCRPWLSPNVEGEVPSAHVSCDQNIRLDPQYTAKSVMCTKTRVEGKRGKADGRWEKERGADNGRGRLGGRADLRTANFHGRQLGANVLCFSALGHGKVIHFHRTCYRQTRNILCLE